MDVTIEKFKELVKLQGSVEKARAFVGDSPIVDGEGNEVEIEAINLTPASAPEEAPEETQEEAKGFDADAVAKAVQDGVEAALKSEDDEGKKRLRISGGDFRNDDRKRYGFKNMAEFGMSVYQAGNPNVKKVDERLYTKAPTGMNQAAGADGGFAVPPEFAEQIWDGLNEMPDDLASKCDTITVTGESLTIPANAETSRANGSRYGGVQGYWIAEADQISNSKPTLRNIKLEPSQLAVLVYATDKLLKNAPALEQYLTRAATEEISFMTNDAIINGNGAGQPLGVLNSGCLVTVAKETGQAATTLVKENIDKVYSRCHAKSRARAVWTYNQDVEPQLEALSMDVGTGGVPVYLPPGGIADTPNSRLKGREAMATEYNATLGTKGDIILGDFMAYALGVAGTVEAAVSMHLRFDYAETAFRFMYAVDGQPYLASAITPKNGTNTLSPFVTLATRA